MTKSIPFTKMHGLGNDFILIDGKDWPTDVDNRSAAVKICDRHFGIGADGLIIIVPPEREDCSIKWLFYNADGSDAEMCGNGIRCLARYALDRNMVDKTFFGVETLAGRVEPQVLDDGQVRVDMGEPVFRRADIPMDGADVEKVVGEELTAGDKTFTITALSMGNPHCVTFVDDVKKFDLDKYGPLVENHPVFPNRVNFEVVQIIDRQRLLMRIWERGVGATLASGTGSCAAALASMINGQVDRSVIVSPPGGDLEIVWDEATDHVFMTGPAAYVFNGKIHHSLLDH